MIKDKKYIIHFNEISIADIAKVGGKNASLGEMYNQLNQKGINIPNGFALTAQAYRLFRTHNKIEDALNKLLFSLDTLNYSNLSAIGEAARNLILTGTFPNEIIVAINDAYKALCNDCGIANLDVAVRSSATAEDLPTASFAGRMESYLNISGEKQLLDAIHHCYASMFTNRAIKYRHDMGFTGIDVAISVGVQQMVRSDLASSGVAFTIDPDTGFENGIVINSCWGLGENIVQGRVTPDEWLLFKPTLFSEHLNPILKKQCGRKEFTMLYEDNASNISSDKTIKNINTPAEKQKEFSLSNNEVIQLAQWSYKIEQHYGKAMDIEWAKDGMNNQLYIVQARPETIHGKDKKQVREIYKLIEKGSIIAKGIALGDKIASGKARIILQPKDGDQLKQGEILVTDITNPDWDLTLKKAAAIITNKGGRTSHAAIVARELGTVAVVGSGNATNVIKDGQEITISCAEGKEGYIYNGILKWEIIEEDYSRLPMPKTSPMLILADPERAFELSKYPNNGVGLLRLEFVISNTIRIHPLALIESEKVTDELIKKEIKVDHVAIKENILYFLFAYLTKRIIIIE
jgi:pyruvate,water dikinase